MVMQPSPQYNYKAIFPPKRNQFPLPENPHHPSFPLLVPSALRDH